MTRDVLIVQESPVPTQNSHLKALLFKVPLNLDMSPRNTPVVLDLRFLEIAHRMNGNERAVVGIGNVIRRDRRRLLVVWVVVLNLVLQLGLSFSHFMVVKRNERRVDQDFLRLDNTSTRSLG